MEEILRVVKALQTSDSHGVSTPANWKPGQEVIMPAPRTAEAAEERVEEEDVECKDWYFCTKEL
jgi:peroxiredoxin (alkyl hydroperoxide reductase subunit C)